ncbi:MAG: hypothetical protein ACRDLY_16400 [Thermoleophilaceae bacterium]
MTAIELEREGFFRNHGREPRRLNFRRSARRRVRKRSRRRRLALAECGGARRGDDLFEVGLAVCGADPRALFGLGIDLFITGLKLDDNR